MKRSLRVWRRVKEAAPHAAAALGFLAVVVTIIQVGLDLTVIRNPAFFIPGAAAVIVYALVRSRSRPIVRLFGNAGVRVEVREGDLFADGDAHLVIMMSDTFDVSPPMIAATSVQAQFLDKVYGGDTTRLTRDIATQLASATPSGTVQKPGNTVRYPMGTTVVLTQGTRRFYLVALSRMDAMSVSRTTVDGLWHCLAALWRELRNHSNGHVVHMAVPGGGQSKLSSHLPAGESAELVILSFLAETRRQKVCQGLTLMADRATFALLEAGDLRRFLSAAADA